VENGLGLKTIQANIARFIFSHGTFRVI
jgi:hypothetical protein